MGLVGVCEMSETEFETLKCSQGTAWIPTEKECEKWFSGSAVAQNLKLNSKARDVEILKCSFFFLAPPFPAYT